MPQEAVFPFSRLPHELQREIIVAAYRNVPGSALKLITVAHKVNDWIQPYIYRIVTLGREDSDLFLRTMDMKPPEFFAAHVKHLCLSISVTAQKAIRILSVCTGVVELALWVNFGGPRSLFAPGAEPNHNPTPPAFPSPANSSSEPVANPGVYLAALALRRLSIEHKHIVSFFAAPRSVRPAWYSTLTHLEVVFWERVLAPDIPGIGELTSLTHLSLGLRHASVHEKSEWVEVIVKSCAKLEVLIPMANEDDELEEPFLVLERCWVVPLHYPASVIANWEASYWGLPDNYTRAYDEIRLKKESGGVEGSSSVRVLGLDTTDPR